LFSFFFTSIPKSQAINAAVSKSNDAVTPFMILFWIKAFITSGNGTPIFSENSFTVILSLIVISIFLTRLADVVAIFSTFLSCGFGVVACGFM
jgi:hypothetical protein